MQALYSDQHRDLARRLRLQVRDGGQPPAPVHRVRSLARRARAPRPDGGAVEQRADRRAAPRSRRRRGPRRARRRAGRPLQALAGLTRATCGPGSMAPPRSSRRRARGGSSPRSRRWVCLRARQRGSRERFMADADAAGYGAGPGVARLVPHHGQRADGRLARHVGVRPDGPDVGGSRPVRVRRLVRSRRRRASTRRSRFRRSRTWVRAGWPRG